MENNSISFVLQRDNFFQLEKIIEDLSTKLYITDSFFAGINVSVEQFNQLVFANNEVSSIQCIFRVNNNSIAIHWILTERIYNTVKQCLSNENCKEGEIILKVVDKINFIDDQQTIVFEHLILNSFEKVYAERASILSNYYKKAQISHFVHHDSI